MYFEKFKIEKGYITQIGTEYPIMVFQPENKDAVYYKIPNFLVRPPKKENLLIVTTDNEKDDNLICVLRKGEIIEEKKLFLEKNYNFKNKELIIDIVEYNKCQIDKKKEIGVSTWLLSLLLFFMF